MVDCSELESQFRFRLPLRCFPLTGEGMGLSTSNPVWKMKSSGIVEEEKHSWASLRCCGVKKASINMSVEGIPVESEGESVEQPMPSVALLKAPWADRSIKDSAGGDTSTSSSRETKKGRPCISHRCRPWNILCM